MNTTVILRYVGNGSYVAGIPANDLTEADIAASGFAIEYVLTLSDGHNPLYVPISNAPDSNSSADDEVTNG